MRDLTFRYSMINTAHFCLKKADLQYIQGIKTDLPDNPNLAFGSAIHASIEAHFSNGDAAKTFRMFWSSLDARTFDWTQSRFGYDELGVIGDTLIRKWLKSHAEHYKALHVEHQMQFEVNGFKVSGKPDFIGYYKDKLSLVDWKTSAYNYDKRKALVDGQTWIYVEGAKQTLGLDIEQVVYSPFVKNGASVQNPIVVPVTQEKLKSMLDNATLVMRDLSTREEFPRNEQNCLRCEYFGVCYE